MTLLSCTKKSSTPTPEEEIQNITLLKSYKYAKDFTSEAYCYFVFQEIISPKEINPDIFTQYIKGATLSLNYLEHYNKWLQIEEGHECRNLIGSNFKSIQNSSQKKYIIFLNLKAIEAEGKNKEITYNHERLHIAFSLYKSNRDRIEKYWQSLTREKRETFLNSHPGYNFKNKDVELREFFAYTFQNNYQEGLDFLTK